MPYVPITYFPPPFHHSLSPTQWAETMILRIFGHNLGKKVIEMRLRACYAARIAADAPRKHSANKVCLLIAFSVLFRFVFFDWWSFICATVWFETALDYPLRLTPAVSAHRSVWKCICHVTLKQPGIGRRIAGMPRCDSREVNYLEQTTEKS